MSVTTVERVVARPNPDPEVRPARQQYPAAYKLKILAELDAADSKAERVTTLTEISPDLLTETPHL